ncbi:hypothetical protein Ddep01_00701 [Deinococcus depolymerans]
MINGNTVRTSRLNGCVQALTPDGWSGVGDRLECRSRIERQAAARRAEVTAAAEQKAADNRDEYENGKAALLQRLKGNARLEVIGESAFIYLYNPTGCYIDAIKLSLSGRTYNSEDAYTHVPPEETGTFTYTVFDGFNLPAEPAWTLDDVEYGTQNASGIIDQGDPACLSAAVNPPQE